MCCRRNQSTAILPSTPYISHKQHRRAQRQARRSQHGCCSSRRQLPVPSTSPNFYPNSTPADQTIATAHQIPTQVVYCGRRRGRGPIGGMAALVIGAIGLGAQKVKEKRDEKKANKAALEWNQEQTAEASRKAAIREGGQRMSGEREVRKSEEARRERRSESLERAEAPPPTYEDVVGQKA